MAAELLTPLLPLPRVRGVVAELLRRLRIGSAECLAEDVRPPQGCASWLDAPAFREPKPEAGDWEDIADRHARGELEVIADA